MNKILPVCATIVLIAAGGWSATPKAIDLELTDDGSSIYILFSDGYIQTGGAALNLGYLSSASVVDLQLTPSGKGYYVLEKNGTLTSFGDAIVLSNTVKDTLNPFVKMVLSPSTDEPYFLQQNGAISTVGQTTLYGDLVRKVKAVDLKATSDGLGYRVLYEDGLIAFFGNAIDYGYTTNTSIKAVSLELTDKGYYVTLANGNILAFGDALQLPFTDLPDTNVTDMVLTDNGYRILTNDGEIHDFLRIEGQGTKWYTKVTTRSVAPLATATNTPTPIPTPTPTRTPKPDTNYFSFTASGFTEKIVGRIPDDSALPSSLDNGYASLFGGGLLIAASASADQPSRKILYFSLKDSVGKSSTGTVFAQLSSERGAAAIRGMAYSKAGLYVVVQDDPGTYIFLITGNFEDATIQGFSLY